MTTPLDWLAEDALDLLTRDSRARVLLWCDPEGEYQPLLADLAQRLLQDDIVLLALDLEQDHGAVWLKWATELGPGAGKRVVLWLPHPREALSRPPTGGTRLDCLLEYTYSGQIWRIANRAPTLYAFFKSHGVPLPSARAEIDAICRGGAESLLAKYAATFLHRDAGFWLSTPLSLALIEERIVGDVEDRLLRLLADPLREWQSLSTAGISSEFCAQVARRYGDVEGLAADPKGWAAEFVASLALLDVYESTGQPTAFPFASRLPPQASRLRLRQLLRRWLNSRDHYETYARYARSIPDVDPALQAWARDAGGRPHALFALARDRWQRFLQELGAHQESDAHLRTYLRSHREIVEEEASGFWASGTGDLSGWGLTRELIKLMNDADEALAGLAGLTRLSELQRAYVDRWHRVDLAHWRILVAAGSMEQGELLAAIADRFYLRYLTRVNQSFYESLGEVQSWPPDAAMGVASVGERLFQVKSGPRAVLVIDALRYDLAVALCDRLGEGQLEATLANLPTETWVGMTSLLPAVDAELRVDDGRIVLHGEGRGDLTIKENRWKYLEQLGATCLGTDTAKRRRDSLGDLLRQQSPPEPLPKLLVLFDRGADSLGHPVGLEVVQHFTVLLDNLERAVRKLKGWGYPQIDIVTDHGFVLLSRDAAVAPMAVDGAVTSAERFVKMAARWGLQRAGDTSPTISVPFALDPAWQIALAPGVRSFGAVGTFFHGGATLQETVIPHVSVATMIARQRMRVTALLPQTDIASLAVKLVLMPERPEQRDLFEGSPESIRLRLFLGTGELPRSRMKEIVVEPDATEAIAVTLFLERQPATPAGTEIPIQVLDMDTGEAYASGLVVRAARDLD